MDPAPSDGIAPASAREGLTERPPPQPAVPPDPEAGRDLRLDLDRPPGRHLAGRPFRHAQRPARHRA
jgi:hypothetical protein